MRSNIMNRWIVFGTALLLGGCVTVNDSKSQIIPASDTQTVVTAKAIAKCQDLFFVVSCDLQVWLESDPPRWKLDAAGVQQ